MKAKPRRRASSEKNPTVEIATPSFAPYRRKCRITSGVWRILGSGGLSASRSANVFRSCTHPNQCKMEAEGSSKARTHQPSRHDNPHVRPAAENKTVIRPVLASPMTVPWCVAECDLGRATANLIGRPTIPDHLQRTVIHALPQFVPGIADYHLSRARCHSRKRKENHKTSSESTESASIVKSSSAPKPDVLNHLVLGLNEVLKFLEQQIDQLKLDLSRIYQAINEDASGHTEPKSPTTQIDLERDPQLVFILVPLASINPQALVDSIPQYCATYNSLVYQHNHLGHAAKTRLNEPNRSWAGPKEEVRVVTLGRREQEMAQAVGLRRITCLGVKVSLAAPKLPLFSCDPWLIC
jgi:hypothetical protein